MVYTLSTDDLLIYVVFSVGMALSHWLCSYTIKTPPSPPKKRGQGSCFCSRSLVNGWKKAATWLGEGWKGPTLLFPPFGSQCQVLFPMPIWLISQQGNWVFILDNGAIECHVTGICYITHTRSRFTVFQEVLFKNAPKYLLWTAFKIS